MELASATGEPIGAALARLRAERGLGLSETARRAGLSKATLANWEAGRRSPSGPLLELVLDRLGVPPRVRAGLMVQADPAHARVALAHEPMGSPVSVGEVLRGMRLRRGLTQTELARSLGVVQATIARWEAGDNPVQPDDLERALGTLEGSEEERRLVLAMDPTGGPRSEENPWERLDGIFALPFALREVAYLFLENDLWHRSLGDPSAKRALVAATNARLVWYFLSNREDDAVKLLRRAVAMAREDGLWEETWPCLAAYSTIEWKSLRAPSSVKREIFAAHRTVGGALGLWFEASGHFGRARPLDVLLDELSRCAPDERGIFMLTTPGDLSATYAIRDERTCGWDLEERLSLFQSLVHASLAESANLGSTLIPLRYASILLSAGGTVPADVARFLLEAGEENVLPVARAHYADVCSKLEPRRGA